MATDPFEPLMTFRPRIAGKRSEADPHRAPLLSADIRRRLRRAPAPKRTGTRAPVRGVAGVTEPGVLSRRCLVKAHFVPMRAGGRDAARLHLAYLERDGVERDGSAGVLYGAGGDFDRVAFAEEIGGERRQFRFIISPEDAEELDLHAFTRALMASMSADLGRPILWAAVNHHNTEHPHVHVVIRGVDAEGRDVRIPPSYIKQDMRWRAQEIATRELGLRSERDIGRQRSAEIGQERPTSLDRKLGELALNGSQIEARDLAQQSAVIAGGAQPGLDLQSGLFYVRGLKISPSASIGINAAPGATDSLTLRLDGVTIDSCQKGGLFLGGAAFDVRNTVVTNNGPGQAGATAWGGILVNALPTVGTAQLTLLTVENNKQVGIACAGPVTGTGVFAANNTGGIEVGSACGIPTCPTRSSTCGASP